MKGYLDESEAYWIKENVVRDCENLSKEEVVDRLVEATLALVNLHRGINDKKAQATVLAACARSSFAPIITINVLDIHRHQTSLLSLRPDSLHLAPHHASAKRAHYLRHHLRRPRRC